MDSGNMLGDGGANVNEASIPGAGKKARKSGNDRNCFDDYDTPTNKIKALGQAAENVCPCYYIGKLYTGKSHKLIEFTGRPPRGREARKRDT